MKNLIFRLPAVKELLEERDSLRKRLNAAVESYDRSTRSNLDLAKNSSDLRTMLNDLREKYNRLESDYSELLARHNDMIAAIKNTHQGLAVELDRGMTHVKRCRLLKAASTFRAIRKYHNRELEVIKEAEDHDSR